MKTIRDEKWRARLIGRLNSLIDDAKPAWGRMTVDQMLSHLVQAGELPFVSQTPDRSSWLSRTLIKPLVLYVLPIPKEVKTSPQMDQQQDGRKPMGFDVDKAKVIDAINKLGELPADHKCLGHPFFGKMSPKQWGMIAYKHIDHHLRQVGA
ncbi:MAG: DUF1569 domain-containing protein [Acidobacteriota bacterium]